METRAAFFHLFLLSALIFAEPLSAQELRFEFSGGLPYTLPLPLTIRQDGEQEIRVVAHFDGEPFVSPYYWVWRISYWSGARSWEFEAIHHKLYLTNNPTEVQHFEITHGLNYFTLNRGWELGGYIVRAGVGVLLAHAENTVRGKTLFQDQGILNWGYYLRGPALSAAAAKQLTLSETFHLNGEVKLSAANVSVPVQNGSAHLFHVAFQATLGIGFRIAVSKNDAAKGERLEAHSQ